MAKVLFKGPIRRSSLLERMEPRLLFSADPLSGMLADGYAPDNSSSDYREPGAALFPEAGSEGNSEADAPANTPANTQANTPADRAVEVVLLNGDLPNLNNFLTALQRESSERSLNVYQLNSSTDGLEQLQAILANHDRVDAVHLFSHGSAGAFSLGGNLIDLDSAQSRSADLAKLANQFSDHADFFLYGCETGLQGEPLLAYLSQQLRVDIAASTDITSNPAQGGNWVLEATQGEFEQASLFHDAAAGEWNGVLGTVTVTTLADTFDAPTSISSIADLIANPGTDGLVSLREAIYAANKSNNSDEIILQSGTYLMTDAGSGDDAGDYDVKETVSIRGAGVGQTTIDANGIERVFDVKADNVVIQDLTLTGGVGSGGESGGAIELDGLNLELNRIEVDGNSTHEGVGGGLYVKSGSTATVSDSVFSENIAGKNQEPNYRAGGGIYNEGTLSVFRTVFVDNVSQNGGGVYNLGTLTIEDSSFNSNSATKAGGGLYSDAGANLEVDRSTFELNTATLDGAGAWVDENSHFDYVTFSNNISSDEGGGLFTAGPNNTVENSTFYGNTSSSIGAALKNTGSLDIKGSVFWGNTSSLAEVIAGTVTSLGFNSWQEVEVGIAVESDLEAQDPLLGTLQNHGGHVKTHLPGSDSPLIDAGFGGAFLDATGTGQNSIPDIGAAESRSTQVLEKIYWVDTAENRIYRANADGSSKQLIHSTADVPFDIEVDSVNGKLYWIEANNHYDNTRELGSLVRANLDGTGRAVLKSGIKFPTGLALDLDSGYIYVSSDHTGDNDTSPYVNEILRFNLDGTGQQTVVSGVSGSAVPDRMIAPTDVEFDPVTDILYWTDRSVTTGTANPEVKMLDIGASGTAQQLFELDKAGGERAYGLAVEQGSSVVSVVTGPNIRSHDYASNSDSYQVISGEVRGIAFAEESDGKFVTTQSGTVSFIGSSSTTAVLSGLAQPGAIAVAYLDPVNVMPVVENAGPLEVDEAGDKTLTTTQLNASDTDTSSADLVFTVTTATSHGSLENSSGTVLSSFSLDDIKAGEVTYVHDSGGATSDEFSFTLTDGLNTTSVDTFSISITQIDDDPVAADDAYTLDEGGMANLDIVGNDVDEEGVVDPGTVVFVTPPANGNITPHGDGTFDYTHNTSETTADSFQYTVEDSAGNTSNVATVSLTINGVNDVPVAIADSATVNEAGNVSINAAGNDTDAENQLDLGSIAVIDNPAYGTATPLANGTIDYIHAGSETLSDSFTYTIKDNAGLVSDKVTVSITITAVNDAPLALGDTRTVDEGSSTALTVLGNDTDADDGIDSTSVAITSVASNGTATANADGTITYIHNGSETINDSFAYTVKDLTGQVSNPATVNLSITPKNDAPVAADNSFGLTEGATYTVNVLANDSDADDGIDTGSVALTAAAVNGVATVNPDGSISYTHGGSETTGDSFKYTVDDTSGAQSNIATVNVAVTPVNDPPVAVADALNLDEGASATVVVLGNDYDDDDGIDNASVTINGLPSHGVVAANPDGSVTYSHGGSETTNDSLTYTVSDLSGAVSNSGTVFISINALNDAPVAADDTAGVLEGDVTTVTVLNNDSDADDGIDPGSVTLSALPANGNVTVNPDGSIRYTHNGSETISDSFGYTVDDLSGVTSNVATVSVAVGMVNDHPVAVDDSITVDEAGVATVTVLSNDSDADDGLDSASVSITVAPVNGSASVNPDGTIGYTHNGSETTGDSLTHVVADVAGNLSNPAVLTFVVNPLNDSPVAVNDSKTVSEGAGADFNVLSNDSDADDGLDAASVAIVAPASNGSVVVNSDGSIGYTHDGSETTNDSFGYIVSDAAGVASNSATVSVSVVPVNDIPVAVADSLLVDEADSGTVAVLANDSDADDGLDPGTLTISAGPANGSASINADNTVSYTHDGSETTSDSFSYTIADMSGATSDLAVTLITVTPVNDAPIAVSDSYTLSEGDSSILTVLANDSDADDGISSVAINVVSEPLQGSVNILADGTLEYTHNGTETTNDSFAYTVDDTTGLASNVAMVSLSITPVNDAPVALDDVVSVLEGGSSIDHVTANDADSDSDIDPVSISISATPSSGFVTVLPDGSVRYLHDGSETHTDSYQYTIEDADGAVSNVATVNVAVTPVNDQPVANADAATLNEADTVDLPLLANDTDSDDGLDIMSFNVISAPAHGVVTQLSSGNIQYQHDGSETSSDSFSYTIADASGLSSTAATVMLTIVGVNDRPVGTSDSAEIDESNSVNIVVLANDTDAENPASPGRVEIISMPVFGTAVVQPDNTVQYAHDGSESVSDTFKYHIEDIDGALSDPTTVNVTINPVNDPPVLQPDAFVVSEGELTLFDLLANDIDADDGIDLTTMQIVSAPAFGIATVNSDGSVAYQHDGGETTADSFRYSIADKSGASGGVHDVMITVLPVNDDPVAMPDTAAVVEAGSTSIDMLANDSDAEEILTYAQVVLQTNPLHGSLTRNVDGSFVYHHDGSESSSDSFSYSLLDGDGGRSAVVPVDIDIDPVDDAPVTVADEFTLNEGDTRQLEILANDTDSDSPLLDATLDILEQPVNGVLRMLDTGIAVYTHDGSETTSDSFVYQLVMPSGLASAPAAVTLNITPINDIPELTIDPTITVTAPFTLVLPASTAVDAEPGPLSYSVSLTDGSALPDSVEFNPETLTLSVVDAQSNDLPEAVKVVVADVEGGEVSLLVYLRPEPGLGAALSGEALTVLPDIGPQIPTAQLTSVETADRDTDSDDLIEPGQESETQEESAELLSEAEHFHGTLALINVNGVMLMANAVADRPESAQADSHNDVEDLLSTTPAADTAGLEQVVTSLLPQDTISLVTLFDSMAPIDTDRLNLLTSSLDDQRDESSQQQLVVRNVVAGSTVATSAVSVGYILWLLRGGVLLGSVLTALPAWRFVDPFPVLSQLGDGGSDDDESLQSIVESEISPDTGENEKSS